MDCTIDDLRTNAFLDWEIPRLKCIISGLDEAIKHLKEKELPFDWYGEVNIEQELESIYGLAVLAFESYLVNVVNYFFDNTRNFKQYFQIEPAIELIIALASIKVGRNFDKKILSTFNLNVNQYPMYPIYKGISLLSKGLDRPLEKIIPILEQWRLDIIDLKYPLP